MKVLLLSIDLKLDDGVEKTNYRYEKAQERISKEKKKQRKAFDTPAQNFASITELEFMTAFGIGGQFNVTPNPVQHPFGAVH